MSGIGGETVPGRLVTVQTELPDNVDGILDAIRKIILMGEVQSLTLKHGEPITYQRVVHHGEEIAPEESTQAYAEVSAYDMVRNVEMEECEFPEGSVMGPHEKLVWMFTDMAIRGWTVTHLVTAELTDFWKWLGMPKRADQSLDQFLGARIEKAKELPADIFILCGARSKQATITEITFSLKGTTYEQKTD